jgi:DNA polymerase-3 subunit epsilon
MYAIVDIETTGGYAERHKITEVAIFIHDGTQVVDTWSSLINPSHYLPGYITGLTGITTAMLQDAPPFAEVAAKIHELLKDKIFVAHNVHFDYSFIKKELEASGFPFNAKKLCTVRLTRKLVPGLTQVPHKVAEGLHKWIVVATFTLCTSNAAPLNEKARMAATVSW